MANGFRWRMSWVMPPGMAVRARSASVAAFGCFARNVSWIVIVSPSYPIRSSPIRITADLSAAIPGLERRLTQQGDEPGVGLERQPVHRRLRAAGDAVHGPRVHARFDEPPLLGGFVQQHLAAQARERGHD